MDRGGTKKEIVVEILEEIMVEILLRLPVKSILKFKTVCKSWYSIISSDRFIREHLKLAQCATYNQHSKFLGVLVYDWLACSTCFSFKEGSRGRIHIKAFDFPIKNLDIPEEEIPMWVCNSCDGLICFQLDDGKTILVWNPSVPMEYKVIDYSSFTPGYAAMGYDPRTDDYKVVLVPRYSVIDGVPDAYFYIPLFSLKRNSWTTLRLPKTKDHQVCNMKIIYAKNRLHWLAGDYLGEDSEDYDDIEDYNLFFVYFDLVEDSLNYVNLPSSREDSLVIPVNYKGCLAIAGGNPRGEQELWVLQEYGGMKSSWNMIFKVSGSWLPMNCCFSRNGRLIICEESGLAIFNTEDGSVEDFGPLGLVISYGSDVYTTPYVESLISPRMLQ